MPAKKASKKPAARKSRSKVAAKKSASKKTATKRSSPGFIGEAAKVVKEVIVGAVKEAARGAVAGAARVGSKAAGLSTSTKDKSAAAKGKSRK